MLILAPLIWVYVRNDMTSERLVLNEVAQFIDRVTDKASITDEDVNDLYMGVNATGGIFDVQIKRYIRMSTKDTDGSQRTLYLNAGYTGNMNVGDVVKVTTKEIGVSSAKRLLWTFLKIDEGKSEITLAGSVR
ncbi:hypothetical protein D3C71_1291450 [compost metagenome]